MDYRVIDRLRTDIETLRLNTEYRHKYIASLNEKRKAEARKAGEPEPPTLTRNILTDTRIQEYTLKVAKEARGVLLEALSIVEDGKPLPDFVREFITFLRDDMPDLSFCRQASEIWENQAGRFLPRFTPYLAKGSAQINTAEGEPLCIPTDKSRRELERIFHALVEARIIDGTAPGALADFLNSFSSQATQSQGRITWIKTAKNGKVSPLQVLDFVAQVAGINTKITAAEDSDLLEAVSAIFGVPISKYVIRRYNFPGERASETSGIIRRILEG